VQQPPQQTIPRTIKELALAVGLRDPEEWGEERRGRTDIPPWRQVGATTNMLLEALRALEDGKEVCVGSYHSVRYAHRLTSRLREFASILGLDQSRIEAPPSIRWLEEYKLGHRRWGGRVFVDHYIGPRY
jgi:hypothetical protein